jgi:hypothetical protein
MGDFMRLLSRASAFLVLTLLACGGLDTFDIEESSTTVVEGGNILQQLVGNLGFSGFTAMDITANEKLKNQGVERQDIDSVKLSSVTLEIVSPASGQDFTFLDSIEFFVEAPGLTRKRIASGASFQAGLRTVGLDIDDVELADYASAESMSITTNATGNQPQQDTTIKATVKLEVDVNVDGALCGG